MTALGSFERLARELPKILGSIGGSLGSDEFESLLAELGLRLPTGLLEGGAIGTALPAAQTALTELSTAAEEIEAAIIAEDRARIAAAAAAVASKAKAFIAAVRGVGDALKADGEALASLTQAQRAELAAFVRSLPNRLFGRLLVEYLDQRASRVVSGLLALGVVEIVEEAGGSVGSLISRHTRMDFSVERLVRLFTDPAGVLREVYNWGTAGFDGAVLFRNVNTLIDRIAGMSAISLTSPPGLDALGFRLAVDPVQSPPALDVSLRFPISFDVDRTLDAGDWEGTFKLKASFVKDLDATIRPLFDVELATPGQPGLFTVNLDAHRKESAEPLLVGGVDGPRLEMKGLKVTLGLDARWDSGTGRVVLDPRLRAEITGAKLVLPELGLDRAFDFAINLSPSGGLSFDGGKLGPVSVETIKLVTDTSGGKTRIGITTDATVELGPLMVRLEGGGVQLEAGDHETSGPFGLGGVDVSFIKPKVSLKLEGQESPLPAAITEMYIGSDGIALRFKEPNLARWLGAISPALASAAPTSDITLRAVFSGTSVSEVRLDWTASGVSRTVKLPFLKITTPDSAMVSLIVGGSGRTLDQVGLALTFPTDAQLVAESSFAWDRGEDRGIENDEKREKPLLALTVKAKQAVSVMLIDLKLSEQKLPKFLRQTTTPLSVLDFSKLAELCRPSALDLVSLKASDVDAKFEVNIKDGAFDFPFLKQEGDGLSQVIQIDAAPTPPSIDFTKHLIAIPIGVTVKLGTDIAVHSTLDLGFDWERVAFSVKDESGLDFLSDRAEFSGEYLGVTWTLKGRPPEADATDQRYAYFKLVTKDSNYQLQQAQGSSIVLAYEKASADPIEFAVSDFALTPKGVSLTARVSDTPVRLNGIDQKFRFTEGVLQIKENRLTDFTLAGSGDLPPDLVGKASVDIALQFGQKDGEITLLAGSARLRGTDKLKCQGTRFQFQVDALALKFVNDGKFHLYFTISGRARFVLAQGDDADGALALLPNIQIDLVECPLTGDARVISKHVNFLVELPKPRSFNFLGAFEMELRGIGFVPQADVFDGDGAMILTGQLKFAQGPGDAPDPRTDFHKLMIGLPKKGSLIPRLHFEGLPLHLNIGEAFRLNGVVDFKDGANEKGFSGEGTLQIQGLPTIAASFAFLRVRRDETAPWVRAWFIYIEIQKVSFLIPVVQIYIREVGLGFGYRYTLVSIAAADRQNDIKKLLAELTKLSRTQGDLSKRDRWAVDLEQAGEDPRWTIALRALFSQTSAAPSPLKWDPASEKNLACLYLADAAIALRSDLTFFMAARAWIYANYYDFATNWENIRERPLLSGFVLLSPRKKRFLAHLASNPDGKIGRNPPMPEFVERALTKCQFSATLLIEPGLVHYELGWPNALVWKDKLGPLEVDNRGGFLLRITGRELVVGVSLLSRGRLDIKAEANLGIVGARVRALAEVAYGVRFIGLFEFRNPVAGSVFYGGIGIEARVEFSVEFWIKLKLGFIKIQKSFRFSLTVGFTAGLEAAYANTSFGLRGHGTISVSCMGRRVQLSASFGLNQGVVENALQRTKPYLDLGLEATEVEPVPGLEAPKPSAARAALAPGLRALRRDFAGTRSEAFSAPDYVIFSTGSAHKLKKADDTDETATYFVLLPGGDQAGFLPPPPAPGATVGKDFSLFIPADSAASGMVVERFDSTTNAWVSLFSAETGGTAEWSANWTATVESGESTAINASGELEGPPTSDQLNVQEYLVHAFMTDLAESPTAVSDPTMLPATADVSDERVYSPQENAFEAAVRGAAEQFQGAPFFKRDKASLYEAFLQSAFDDQTSIYAGGTVQPADVQSEQQAHELRGVIVHDMVADLRAYAANVTAPAGAAGTDRSILFQMGLAFRVRGGRPGWLDGAIPGVTLSQRASTSGTGMQAAKPVTPFNTATTSFTANPPQLRRLQVLTEAATIGIAWELAWPEPPAGVSGAAADPEHHLLNYEVRRRALDGAEREAVYTVKAADVLHRTKDDSGVETLQRLRPRFQVADHFGEDTQEDLAALPTAGRSYLYTITPVDFSGNKGRPASLVATRRPSAPPLVPVDAQAVLAYAISKATFDDANLANPSEPKLLIPNGLKLTWSDPGAPAGAPLVPVAKTYLVFRKERTLPAGSYGLDAATDRPRSSGLPSSNARRLPTDIVIEIKPTGSSRARQVTLAIEDLRKAGVFPQGTTPRWLPQGYRLFIQTESLAGVRSALAPVGYTLRVSTSGSPDAEDKAPREERCPAELEWLPAPMVVDLLPPEDARAETGTVHVPVPVKLADNYHFKPDLGNVSFQAHPAGPRVVRFRFNQAPSDKRSYALDLAASYDLLELDIDSHSTTTFAKADELAAALRPVAEVQIVSAEDLLLLPGDTLAPAQWEAFYPSTSLRLSAPASRPEGAEQKLGPWYSWRESVLTWPTWPGLTGLTDASPSRSTSLHPALDMVLDLLQAPPSAAIHGGLPLQIDRQASPATQPGSLGSLLTATAPAADPYGWNLLQRLGLAVTLALRDPSTGKVLDGPKTMAVLGEVFAYLDGKEPGETQDRWTQRGAAEAKKHIFVEALFRPGAHIELSAVSEGKQAERLLAIVQLSLRPKPTPYLLYKAFTITGPARAQAKLTFEVPKGETLWVVNQTEPDREIEIEAPTDDKATRELTLRLGFDGRLSVLMRGAIAPATPTAVVTDSKTGKTISAADLTIEDSTFDARDKRALYFTAPTALLAARIARNASDDPVALGWRAFTRHLEALSSTDPSVPEAQKIRMPTGTGLPPVLPDLLAWTQRFFDASDPVLASAEGPFIASAYPRAANPAYATPDASGRLSHDHLVEDPWGHLLRYYVRPHARYDRLWRGLQQSPSLFPPESRPPVREVLPKPADPALDVVLDRVRPVAAPLVLSSARLDGLPVPAQPSAPGRIWEVIVAEHHEQALIEHNQTLVRQLAFRGIAFTLVRQFAYFDWAEWLGELGGGESIELEIPSNAASPPPPPTVLAAKPDHLDLANLSEDERRALDLPMRLGAFAQGATVLQWEALPFFYHHLLMLIAQTTRVVSPVNQLTQKDFEYVTPQPVGSRAGEIVDWTPPAPFGEGDETMAIPVHAIGVGLPLRRLWESVPVDAQAQWPDEAPDDVHCRPGWLADLEVVYQIVEQFLGNVETQGEVFFDGTEGVQCFDRRQLGTHFLVDVGAFAGTTNANQRFEQRLVVQPVSEEALSRVYGDADKKKLSQVTRQKVAFVGQRLRFVGPPNAVDRGQLTAMLDAADKGAVDRIAAGFVTEEPVTAELSPPSSPSLGEIEFIDPRGLVLVWEGPMTDAEASDVQALSGDPELKAALKTLATQAKGSASDAVTVVSAPLGADQVPTALRGRVTFTTDAGNTSYATVSWTGVLYDDDLVGLERWAQIQTFRTAVGDLHRQADAARFAVVVTPPRPLPEELSTVLQGRLTIEAEQLTWKGPAPSDAERAALLAVRGDAGFEDARARLLALIDQQRNVPLPPEVVPSGSTPQRPTPESLPAVLQGRLEIGAVLAWNPPSPNDAERAALLGLNGDSLFNSARDSLLALYDADHSVAMTKVARRPRQADVPAALAGALTIDPERVSWSGRLHNPTQRAALAGLAGDPPFAAAIASILASLDAQVLTAVFVSPVRVQQAALGALGDKLLLGRALLRHRGLLAADEARGLRALFSLAVDQHAIERLYRRSQGNPFRQRVIKLRARRGTAAPSVLVDIPLDPLS